MNEQSKWKTIYFLLIILNLILLTETIPTTYFINKDEESENNESEEEKNWKPAGDRIKTKWGKKLEPSKVWQEYPRPQMAREKWTNLNGFWDYFICSKGEMKPDIPDGKILVPFPIESSLSGIMRVLTEKEELWYEKKVIIKNEWRNKSHILLHFGAVDYITEVFVNYNKVGEHIGGYSPFYFDIIDFIDFSKNDFFITIKVFDPTDKGYQAVGKQTLTPGSIWYTSISGIWQTVWIESMNDNYIKNIDIKSDFDKKQILLKAELNSELELPLSIKVYYKDNTIYDNERQKSNTDIIIQLKNDNFYPWSPDEPNLYNIEISVSNENGIVDSIKTYTAIRKIAAERDSNGILRYKLNNKVLFHIGPLDQGYFPDGLYTPPSEEAMIFDIQKIKDLGFNTIRKHAKVENARYYYYCDKIGIMVWQDMPAGDIAGSNWDPSKIGGGSDKKRTEESKNNYYHEWEEIINFGKFFPCIVVWTPFNEGWGQFDTEIVANFTKEKDPTRLINSASGGNHRICGDILDIHSYPSPIYTIHYDGEINVLGEYGGLGLEIKGHTWKDDNWGYVVYKSKDEITYYYSEFAKTLEDLAQEGYAAAIYTQTTDCESEINGLITYDREEIKVIEDKVKEANINLINSIKE